LCIGGSVRKSGDLLFELTINDMTTMAFMRAEVDSAACRWAVKNWHTGERTTSCAPSELFEWPFSICSKNPLTTDDPSDQVAFWPSSIVGC
jgi:hypothetical protein